MQTCSTTLSRAKWRFTSPVTQNGFQYFHIRSEAGSALCIGTLGGGVANNTTLNVVNCSSGVVDSQIFAFIP